MAVEIEAQMAAAIDASTDAVQPEAEGDPTYYRPSGITEDQVINAIMQTAYREARLAGAPPDHIDLTEEDDSQLPIAPSTARGSATGAAMAEEGNQTDEGLPAPELMAAGIIQQLQNFATGAPHVGAFEDDEPPTAAAVDLTQRTTEFLTTAESMSPEIMQLFKAMDCCGHIVTTVAEVFCTYIEYVRNLRGAAADAHKRVDPQQAARIAQNPEPGTDAAPAGDATGDAAGTDRTPGDDAPAATGKARARKTHRGNLSNAAIEKKKRREAEKWESRWDTDAVWRLEKSLEGRSREDRHLNAYASWRAENAEDLPPGPPLTTQQRDRLIKEALGRIAMDTAESTPDGTIITAPVATAPARLRQVVLHRLLHRIAEAPNEPFDSAPTEPIVAVPATVTRWFNKVVSEAETLVRANIESARPAPVLLLRYLQLRALEEGLKLGFPRHHLVPTTAVAEQAEVCWVELNRGERPMGGLQYHEQAARAKECKLNPTRDVGSQLGHYNQAADPNRGRQGKYLATQMTRDPLDDHAESGPSVGAWEDLAMFTPQPDWEPANPRGVATGFAQGGTGSRPDTPRGSATGTAQGGQGALGSRPKTGGGRCHWLRSSR